MQASTSIFGKSHQSLYPRHLQIIDETIPVSVPVLLQRERQVFRPADPSYGEVPAS